MQQLEGTFQAQEDSAKLIAGLSLVSAGFALLPLMIEAGAPGKEILHPVAIVIFGGLVSATLLDTLLTPVLFLKLGRKPVERLAAGREGSLRPSKVF